MYTLKITVLIFFIYWLYPVQVLKADDNILKKRITVNYQQMSVTSVLEDLRNRWQINIAYANDAPRYISIEDPPIK